MIRQFSILDDMQGIINIGTMVNTQIFDLRVLNTPGSSCRKNGLNELDFNQFVFWQTPGSLERCTLCDVAQLLGLIRSR